MIARGVGILTRFAMDEVYESPYATPFDLTLTVISKCYILLRRRSFDFVVLYLFTKI